jgi:hypothetical protein
MHLPRHEYRHHSLPVNKKAIFSNGRRRQVHLPANLEHLFQ